MADAPKPVRKQDEPHLNRRQRIELRNKTERMGELFDWSNLSRHYHEAHELAMSRTGGGSGTQRLI